jgi:hypothetical protein
MSEEAEVLEQQVEEAPPEPVVEPDEQAEGFDTPVDADENAPEQEEEQLSDIDALIQRLSSVETATKDVGYVKHRVDSELNRLEGIQSRVDRLTKSAETMASADRMEQLEGTISELTDLIMMSDAVDDSTKIELRERQLERRLQAIEKTGQGQAPVADAASSEGSSPERQVWDDATAYVAEQARAIDFDPAQIPVDVWKAGADLGSPVRASDHVLAWIRSQTENLEKVEQTAAKKRAAGNGTPTRSGTSTSIDDLVRSFGEGKDITDAEKLRVMEHLGVRA